MFYDIKQNSPEWFQKRLGLFTSSSIASLFKAKTTLEYQKLIAVSIPAWCDWELK